jgi:hypothetical protein
MRKTLFGRLRPGPAGRTIEEPGLIPAWLQVALAGAIGAAFIGLLLYQLGRWVFG